MDLLRRLCLLLALGIGAVFARAGDTMEYRVKGAYLFKFGDYVEWPASALPKPGMPFVIGILGDDPFGPRLDQVVRGHTIQGRPIQVKRFKRVEEVWDVQILFLGRTEPPMRERIMTDLEGLSILTVSDGEAYPGVILRFVTLGNKVRFEANLDAAEHLHLKLSSKLLDLATAVKKTAPPRDR